MLPLQFLGAGCHSKSGCVLLQEAIPRFAHAYRGLTLLEIPLNSHLSPCHHSAMACVDVLSDDEDGIVANFTWLEQFFGLMFACDWDVIDASVIY